MIQFSLIVSDYQGLLDQDLEVLKKVLQGYEPSTVRDLNGKPIMEGGVVKKTWSTRPRFEERNILLLMVSAATVQEGEKMVTRQLCNVLETASECQCELRMVIGGIDKDKTLCQGMANAVANTLSDDDLRRRLLQQANQSYEHVLDAALHVPALAEAFVATKCFTLANQWELLKAKAMSNLEEVGLDSNICARLAILPALPAHEATLKHLLARKKQVQALAGYSVAALIAAVLDGGGIPPPPPSRFEEIDIVEQLLRQFKPLTVNLAD